MKKTKDQKGAANRTLVIVTALLVLVTGIVWVSVLYNRKQNTPAVPVEFQDGNIPPPLINVTPEQQ